MATVRHDLCQRDGYSLPDPSVAPTPEPSVDCVPVPIFRRNIAPWRAAAEPPKYAVDNQTVLLRTASAPPARRVHRQQTPHNPPFRLAPLTSAHPPPQLAPFTPHPPPPSTQYIGTT